MNSNIINRLFYIFFIVFLTAPFTSNALYKSKNGSDSTTFKLGEHLEYKLKYGWFTLGKGTIKLDKELVVRDGQNAYQMRIHARTAGLASLTASIDDHYYSVISTKDIKPLYSEKHVKVVKDDWDQWNEFDYDSMKVDVKVKDHRKEDPNRNWEVKLTDNTYGILSTYLYFRNTDWGSFAVGDSTIQKIFYERRLYYFGVEYGGIEYLKMNGKKIKAHKLYLLLEKSGTFPNKRSVAVWSTADDNKYPIRIQAKMKFGSVKIDLVSFNGEDLKHYQP